MIFKRHVDMPIIFKRHVDDMPIIFKRHVAYDMPMIV